MYGEAQKKEIETIKPRTLTLELSDADVTRITNKAGAAGLTVAELLQNFIGDLVCGTYTNGSDERMYAQDWFERCWFGSMPETTFLRYLINYSDGAEYITDLLAYIESAKAEVADIEANPEEYEPEEKLLIEEDIADWKSQIDDAWNEYTRNQTNEHGSFEEEVEKILEWKRQKDRFMGETE